MSNVFLFVPKAQLTCYENLNEFVLMCRDRLTVFGEDLDWYSHAWPGVGTRYTLMTEFLEETGRMPR